MVTFKGIELETNDVSFRPTLITEACAEVVNFSSQLPSLYPLINLPSL